MIATPWSVDLVWGLEAGPGRLWAGCLPAGLFTSDDGGASWQLVESLWERPERKEWFGGGYDHAGIHSILVDPRDGRHVTIGDLMRRCLADPRRGRDLDQHLARHGRRTYMPPERRFDANIQDVHRIDQCRADPDVLWCQHHGGLYRSVDGGPEWHAIPAPQPSAFGFPVAAHPVDPRRAWFAPAHSDAQRIPVDGRMVVNETRDGGASFVSHSEGLPQRDAYHLIYRHALWRAMTARRWRWARPPAGCGSAKMRAPRGSACRATCRRSRCCGSAKTRS